MAAIVEWEYYHSHYDKVSQTDFSRLEPLAEKRVKVVVGLPRWKSINHQSFYYDQLRDCICMVIDKLAAYEGSGAGAGLSSVSNDGYTENYAVQTQPQMEQEIHSCIVQWLSGTGLAGAYKW